jgi:hypothetical protein
MTHDYMTFLCKYLNIELLIFYLIIHFSTIMFASLDPKYLVFRFPVDTDDQLCALKKDANEAREKMGHT